LGLRRGSVVINTVQMHDPNGVNPKANRPLVVVSSNEDIGCNPDTVVCIAISKSGSSNYSITLPWNSTGNVSTGLRSPSFAVCDWQVKVPIGNLVEKGRLKVATLYAVMQKIHELEKSDG